MTFIKEHLRSYKAIVLDSFVEELTAFSGAVHGQTTAIGTALDGLRTIEIAEAAAGMSATNALAHSGWRQQQ